MAVASPHAPSRVGTGPVAGAPLTARSRPAWALLLALIACLLYAAFADGATALPDETWLQLALAAIATAACASWLYGSLRLGGSPLAWIGLALLVAFAAWTAASIAWSVAPDRSWAAANRALAYVLVAWLGIVLGSSLPRAAERLALALALASLPVALYALGGKTLPGIHIEGVLNLDHAAAFNRLKAPLEYWNALALFCVTGLLPMLRLAADPARRAWARIGGLVGVFLLVLVVGMTYSRGGILALGAGLVTLVALTTERVRTLTLFVSALLASTVPLAVALTRPTLTSDALPLAMREDDARVVFFLVVASAVALALWGRALIALERRRVLTPERGRRIGRPLAIVAGVLVAVGLLNAVATGRVASAFESFTDTKKGAGVTDPNRLLSSSSGNRWTWWKEAAGVWSDKPVAGWGAGSFAITHLHYRKELLSVRQPHSVPLQWLAETGVVGLLLVGGGLLALLAAALARVRATEWRVGGAPAERGAAAALLAIAVAWVAHAFYDWDWDIPAVTIPMLLCLGVLAARRPAVRATAPAARGPALAAAVLLFVLVAVSAVLPALAETRTSSALEIAGSENVGDDRLAQAASRAELASRLNPLAVEPLFAVATIAERRGRIDEARAALLRALRKQPNNVDGWVRLLRLDFTRLDRAALRRSAVRGLELDPVNPGTIGLARRAWANAAFPFESATATGSPLPTQVPITDPAAQPVPTPAPGAPPTPTPTPTPVP